MRASIIAVGTELLFGQTVNTNATYLSKNLNLMGFDVMFHYVVGDNPRRLEETIDVAFQNADLVLLTGGLGPTQDDLTKEIVAEYMGVPLILDDNALAQISEYFEIRKRKMTENNVKQAYLPLGCTAFYNETGTAPGFALEKDGRVAMCFPGPPHELEWLFEHCAKPYLATLSDKKMYYRIVRTIGIGESDLETALLPLIDGQSDPTIATYAKEGECSFRVASQRDTMDEAKEAVNQMLDSVTEIIGEYIYSYDDEEIVNVVVRMLAEKNLTIASCESATAGMFASRIADVPGASAVMGASFVTYSDQSKIDVVGVNKETIDEFGVVSGEVATEMALGARLKAGSDIGISITAYAGPDIPEGYNPGEGYIGYAYGDKAGFIRINGLRNDRSRNRNFYMMHMLRTVYRLVRGLPVAEY